MSAAEFRRRRPVPCPVRQVKPGNILANEAPGGEVVFKLSDFGSAEFFGTAEEIDSISGTEWYNAPEKRAGHR